jgi:hypothetical protein
MFPLTRLLAVGIGLAMVTAVPQDQQQMAAVAAIVKLADNLDRPDVAVQAKKIVTEFDSCDISSVFAMKRRTRGLGIGSAVQAGHRDSINDLVIDWAGPRPPTLPELRAHQNDLLKVARVLQAMAELAPFRMPLSTPQQDQKKAKEWQTVSAEFKAVTQELRDSLEKIDPSGARKAAVRLHRTCNACHKLVGI